MAIIVRKDVVSQGVNEEVGERRGRRWEQGVPVVVWWRSTAMEAVFQMI